MILDFSQNGINISFEVSEKGILTLREFELAPYRSNIKKDPNRFPAAVAVPDIVDADEYGDHIGLKLDRILIKPVEKLIGAVAADPEVDEIKLCFGIAFREELYKMRASEARTKKESKKENE